MNLDADSIVAELEGLEQAWVELDARARELEELQKPILMQMTMEERLGSRSFSEAEAKAMAGEAYRDHVVGMVEARKQANVARARLNRLKVWIELKRTNAASERAMINLR